jgi:hypothetical protein
MVVRHLSLSACAWITSEDSFTKMNLFSFASPLQITAASFFRRRAITARPGALETFVREIVVFIVPNMCAWIRRGDSKNRSILIFSQPVFVVAQALLQIQLLPHVSIRSRRIGPSGAFAAVSRLSLSADCAVCIAQFAYTISRFWRSFSFRATGCLSTTVVIMALLVRLLCC